MAQASAAATDGGRDRAADREVAATAAGLGSEEGAGAAGARRGEGAADHDSPDFGAAQFGASAGSASAGGATIPARSAERALADGFQRVGGMNAGTGPLSVLDDHSRYAIALAETGSTRAEAVRERLEEAFQRCGVPDGMLMDHGTPWWNMQAAAGWTWLTVWLMKQGMKLHFSGYRHPQTQGTCGV